MEGVAVAYMLLNFEVDDYDTWKRMFDGDPAGRAQSAKGHVIFRGVEEPSKVFIGVEFPSVEEANSFRERLIGSGALDNPASFTIVTPPTVVEEADRAEY